MVISQYARWRIDLVIERVMFDTFRNGKRKYVVLPLASGRVFCLYVEADESFVVIFCHFLLSIKVNSLKILVFPLWTNCNIFFKLSNILQTVLFFFSHETVYVLKIHNNKSINWCNLPSTNTKNIKSDTSPFW